MPTFLPFAKRHEVDNKVALREDCPTTEIALGNIGTESDIPLLSHALLGHDLSLVRGHAAWALGRLGGITARRALDRARRTEQFDAARNEVVLALDAGT